MLFDLICDDGSVWRWESRYSTIYRPNGKQVFPRQFEFAEENFTADFNPHTRQSFIGSLEVILGEKCNFDCRYCYQKKMREEGVGWATSPKDIESFVSLLKQKIPDIGGISFWGGEPLVYRKTLMPLVEALRKAYPKVSFYTVTNGSLIDREFADWSVKVGLKVQISADGNAPHREHNVPVENMDALKYLCEKAPVTTRFHSVDTGDCSPEETRRYFKDLGYKVLVRTYATVRLVPEQGLTYLSDDRKKAIEQHAYDDMMVGNLNPWFKRVSEGIKIGINPYGYAGPCPVGIGQRIAVNLKGDIFPCHAYFQTKDCLGNLKDYPNIPLKGFVSPSNRKQCQNCPFMLFCRGYCPTAPETGEEICIGRKSAARGVMRATLKKMLNINVLDIKPSETQND